MKATRKLLVLIAVVALMIAAFAVIASAYVSNPTNSSYADIKNNKASWVQIAGGTATDANEDGDYLDEGDLFTSGGNYRAYYNESTKTVSIEMWKDGLEWRGWSGLSTTTNHFAYWLTLNADNIEHFEVRNVSRFEGVTYIIGCLTKLKTMTIGDMCDLWYATSSNTQHFYNLTSLESVKFGTWNKATGAFTETYAEAGAIDLRGFKHIKPSVALYQDANHIMTFAGSAIRTTAAKKVILPLQQTIDDDTYSFNRVVISDESEEFVEGNPKQTSTYGTAITKGSRAYVLQDAEGKQYYSTNNWSLPTGWSKVMDLAKDTAPYYGDYTGIIPWAFAYGVTTLEEVVVPEGLELRYIEPNAFNGCTGLKTINVYGTVASDMKIASKDAFSKVTDLVINVYDADSKTNMENALTAAGITATVNLIGEEPEEPEEPVATMPAGVDKTSDQWIDSGYTDVDTETGWYLMATNEKDTSTTATSYPTFAYKAGTRFYWNKTTGEAVWLLLSTSISGDWGNETEVSGTKNVLENGIIFHLAWLLNKLATDGYVFESVEFRLATGVTSCTYATLGLETRFMEAKTILFDSRMKKINFQTTDRGLFRYVASLKTFDHVTYKSDKSGDYTETVEPNVVDLRGITTYAPYTSSNPIYIADRIFRDSTGIQEIIWFDTLKSSSDSTVDSAGVIDALALYNCSGLTKITIPATLTAINDRAFANCKKLATIDLKGGIAAGATVHADAFTGVTAVEIIVYSGADELRAKALFTGSKFTFTNKNPISDALSDAIRADGFSIRINNTNAKTPGPALRAEFTLLQSNVKAAGDLGYTLSNYGIIVFSDNTLEKYYNGDIDAVLEAAKAGTDTRIIKKSAKNGPYVNGEALETNPNLDKVFAAAVTGIPEGNYTSELYTYAYAVWTKGEETTYTYTTYVSGRTGKAAHSLCDMTVFAFRNGVVNSQNYNTGVDLWSILEKGALTVDKSEVKALNENLVAGYTFTNDKFTYLDEPLRAWKFHNKSAGEAPAWNSYGSYVEATSTTNVLWSILKDGGEYVVAYRRDPNATGTAVIPSVHEGYTAFAPYSTRYFDGGVAEWVGGKQVTNYKFVDTATEAGILKGSKVYTPILSEANAEKITAIVVDYGVNEFKTRALETRRTPSITTIVYPEGVKAGGELLIENASLVEVIYASEKKTSLTAATQVEGFGKIVDLSGLTGFSLSQAFLNNKKVENIILPTANTGINGIQNTFSATTALKRVWTIGSAVPTEGTVDLRQTGVKLVCKRSMAFGSNITNVYMPTSFQGISSYSMGLSEKDANSQVFGADLTYTIHLGTNEAALTGASSGIIAFHNALQTKLAAGTLTSAQADNMSKIKFACTVDGVEMTKTAAEWKTYYDAIAEMLAPPANGEQPKDTLTLQGDTYKLTFFDGFSGTTLDSTKWAKCPEGTRQDLGGKWDDDRAYLDGNGYLVLEAMRDSSGNLTSGAIRTRNKSYSKTFFEQTRGYFECRVKLQSKPGFWSAFWLMASGDYNVGNGATDWAEIDIMESYSVAKKGINHAIHWDGYGADHKSTGKSVEGINVYDGEFHTFGLLWTETAYIFYIDGIESYRLTEGMSDWPGSCQVPVYLKLTNEFGNWADDMDGSAFTDQVLYDYVRVYAKQ